MRGGAIAFAGAALAAGAASFALNAPKPQARAVEPPAGIAPFPAGNRVFLTKLQLDQAIASGTFDRPVKSLLAVKAPLHFGDYSWDDRGVPAGPTWIRVDLGSQLISVFPGGDEIGAAGIVHGGANQQTPRGARPNLRMGAPLRPYT